MKKHRKSNDSITLQGDSVNLAVSRTRFDSVLRKLIQAKPIKREDVKTGGKLGKIVPPRA